MEHMPSDENPFPQDIDLGIMDEILENVKKYGHRMVHYVAPRPTSAPDYMSEHYHNPDYTRIATPEELKDIED